MNSLWEVFGVALLGSVLGGVMSAHIYRRPGHRPRDNGQTEPPPPPAGRGPVATDE